MNNKVALLVVGLCLVISLSACNGVSRTYKKEVIFGKTLEFRPKLVSTGGSPGNHPCINGSYNHVYETDQGMYGQSEVWLCCVPVNEILRDSFNCGGNALPVSHLFSGGEDYWKIRTCHLLHPTETEPTFIPVCIPAPLQVDVENR